MSNCLVFQLCLQDSLETELEHPFAEVRIWLTLGYFLSASDPESGVARGIDFHHVSAVLNFDLPPTAEAYVHRAGR